MRYNLKKIILLLLYYLSRNRQNNGLLVLTYHRITDTPDYDDPLKVSKNIFEKQIQFLKENYKIISGDELLEIIQKNKTFQENTCLITFDDGWKDNYTNAYPILKKYNIPVIIFISTDYIGTENIFWHEQLQELLNNIPPNTTNKEFEKLFLDWPEKVKIITSIILRLPKSKRQLRVNELISILKHFDPEKINGLIIKLSKHFNRKLIDNPLILSWSEINEMSNNKICFGSHTKSHAILTQINEDEIENELSVSKNVIENKIGKKVNYLSYPNGDHNKKVMKIAENVGYVACFACIAGLNNSFNNLFSLKRKHIRENNSLGLNKKFSKTFFKIDLSDLRHRLKRKIT